jgi:menin
VAKPTNFFCSWTVNYILTFHNREVFLSYIFLQKLLWLLYDNGHLSKYPAALATLADMEEVKATEGRPLSSAIYVQAIESARLHYDNMHVYPYTYYGNYHYRRANYKQALHSWAQAAAVISR